MYILRTPAEIIAYNLRICPDILRTRAENRRLILRIVNELENNAFTNNDLLSKKSPRELKVIS